MWWACALGSLGPAQQQHFDLPALSPKRTSKCTRNPRTPRTTTHTTQAMTSPNDGAAVIAEAQAFVAAAKARQDDRATKTSSLQALQILQDHDVQALASILGTIAWDWVGAV